MLTEVYIPSFEALIIFFIILYLVREYADRARTPTSVVIFTIISWFMSFSMVMFVPLDIYLVSYLFSCNFNFPCRQLNPGKIRTRWRSGGTYSTGAVSS